MNFIKNLTSRLVGAFSFSKEESIGESKKKWNLFGSTNPRYYVFTKHGESIDEELFRSEGRRDYDAHIASDPFLTDHLKEKGKVLEIGCGAGRITEFLSQNFREVWGVDISESMIAEAGRRLAGRDNVRLISTDGMALPAPENYFDFVFSFIVFQHMPSVDVVASNIKEIARVLKPGGIAKIQLRGIPIARSSEFYGPSFDQSAVEQLLAGLPLRLARTEGEGQKYFWLWLEKHS